MKNKTARLFAAGAITLIATSTSFAANATWLLAPATAGWLNTANWSGAVVPGTINNTGNNGTDTASIATFTNAITGTIGTAANPIIPDDATVVNGKARMLSRLNFDGPNCGAYVFSSPSAYAAQTASTPETGVLSLCIASSAAPINGSFLGAAVTNPQTFLIPVQIRLPSSTTGTYGFTNNATSVNATYFFKQMFLYPGATGRANTWVLAGSNTGTNTIASLSQSANQSGASCGIRKEGSGTWILSGANTFNAGSSMFVTAGTLIAKDPAAFGVATAATANGNGVLQIDGVTLGLATVNLANSGVVRMNGSATLNGVTVSTTASTTPIVATTSASDVLTIGNAGNKVTAGLAGNSVLHTAGPGNIQLPFANNYVGNWSVDAGRLDELVVGALGTGANLNIAAGAIFSVTNATVGGGTYTLDTANLSASGIGVSSTAATIEADAAGIIDLATGSKGISLTFTPTAFLGDTTHPALYVSQGTLALAGNAFSINNAGASPLGVGTYRIIQQASGSITDGGSYSVTGVTGSGLTAGNVASVVVSGGNVNLVVSPYVPKNLVWTGGAVNANWNIATDANWLNGVSPIIFNNSDNVTFNSVGSTNPTVTLAGTLSPSSVLVSNTAAYTFNGGQIAGGASLVKKGSGSLLLNQANTYGGGTVVSNGTLQVGINNAISGTGAGDVAVQGSAVIDLNNNSISINGLNGNGTVDVVTGGGASTLSIGNNNNSGVFSGVLKNTTGTLALTKAGSGTETLSGNNTYSGATTINLGTLKVTNPNALGSGSSAVTLAGGILDLGSSVTVGSIAGTLGTIANNSTATTNTLIVQGASTYGATIADGSGGGGVAVLVSPGANLRLNAANSYSGGTIVSAGAVFQIGNVGSMGAGGVIASNGAVVGMSNANNPSAGLGNTITTADNSTVLLTGGGNQANNFFGQFVGGPTATNVLTNACSIGGANSFAGFNGTVIVGSTANGRFFTANNGGDNTTFDFQGGNLFSRDANTIRFGALQGGSQSSSIGSVSFGVPATYIIGNKGLSTTFSGGIGITNNIVKSGAGSLTLNGINTTTNTDSASFTNYLYVPIATYWGSTVVSNGTLAIIAPNNLTNSSSITLAGVTAVLDASKMGYASNYVDPVFSQNVSDIYTNGILNLAAVVPLTGGAQSLSGIGSITGQLVADTGTTVSPGLPTGLLTVSGNVTLNAVNMNVSLNRTNSPNCGELAASGASTITVNGGTLTVTAAGDDLVTGDVFHVFNKASIGNFTITNLPASNALATISYVFTNKLAIDGTIVVVAGASAVNLTPTNMVAVVNGNNLEMSWPADHTGWVLQAQTNTLSTGLNGNWVTILGTDTNNHYTNTIRAGNGTVFYRMFHPCVEIQGARTKGFSSARLFFIQLF
ncbi:MAG: hypothetical protein RL616_9 [Verrucomicrobiota bacterium]